MAHPVALGLQVGDVVVVGVRGQRHLLDDGYAVALQAVGLGRVVGHQPHRGDTEVLEDLGGGAVVAGVGGQAQVEVGVDGVATAVLQLVGLQLGQQADAAPLVAAEVDHHAASLGDDPLHGLLELGAAVAAAAGEDVTGQALGVDAGQDRLPSLDVGEVAVHEGDVLGAVDRDPVADRGEVAGPRGQPGGGDPVDVGLDAAAVVDHLLDRDHLQAVLVGEGAQLGSALHGAVVVDDLDEHADRGQPGHPGQVDGGLGVAAADQHAALAVAQREDVAGAGDLPRLGGRVGQRRARCGSGRRR